MSEIHSFASDTRFSERVTRIFRERGERSFLCFIGENGRIEKTFAEFEADLRRAAAGILARSPSAEIAVCVGKNTYPNLVNITSSLLLGLSVMPLNGAEPEARIAERAAKLARGKILLREDEPFSDEPPYSGEWRALKFPDEMFFIPSSGSTGEPKTIRQPERAVLANCEALIEHHAIDPDRTWIGTPLPIFHVNALEFSFLCSLLRGARVTLFESFDPVTLLREIRASQITVLSLIPPVIRALTSLADRIDWKKTSVRYTVSAAAPLSCEIAKAWQDTTGIPVIQGYGMSEAVNFSLTMPIETPTELYRELTYEHSVPSAGVELRGNELAVLDEEGRRLGEGQSGELAIRGANLMSGYLGEPDLTGQFFRTGDLGFYVTREGRRFFFINGRKKDVIKKSGSAISLREIDDFVSGILKPDSISVPHPDPVLGENFGIVVRGKISEAEKENLRQALVERFGKLYSLSAILETEESLRTPSGKPQRFRFSIARLGAAEALRKSWEHLNPGRAIPNRSEVRRVCVLLSASRSGSSFLFHLLSRHPSVISPLGEETPFYRLAGLGTVRRGEDSDALGSITDGKLEEVASWILRDSARLAFDGKAVDPADAVFRLLLQWPALSRELERLIKLASELCRVETQPEAFWKKLIAKLAIPAFFYDFSDEKRASSLPISELTFEDPPFVIPKPRYLATSADFRDRVLLLKSSFNSYRIPLLRRLFPNAEISAVHLSRNPAGCINGLMDGWQSGGFHSHDLNGIAELAIEGYSRAEAPETKRWWKFDLPPGWARMTHARLEEVCAFQWSSANRAILRDLPCLDRSLRVHYENLLDSGSLKTELRSIFEFLGMSSAEVDFIVQDSAPIMAVNPPAKGKWKARSERILPMLARPDLRELAAGLGYDLTRPEDLP